MIHIGRKSEGRLDVSLLGLQITHRITQHNFRRFKHTSLNLLISDTLRCFINLRRITRSKTNRADESISFKAPKRTCVRQVHYFFRKDITSLPTRYGKEEIFLGSDRSQSLKLSKVESMHATSPFRQDLRIKM
ncbi:hypothetical protein Fmac_018178 [Flemingia macrophylla]|uniref:Uncharacterized protein n=1 Tax=Flemingia macrophylla TaxID=520843 RepID=A0ABD1M480_9FABA